MDGYFNSLQERMFDTCYGQLDSFAVSAPTGAGKTVCFELALLAALCAAGCVDASGRYTRPQGGFKVVYLAPMRAIVTERLADWKGRFGVPPLSLRIAEMTGSTEADGPDGAAATSWTERSLRDVDILLATPEKFDSVSRRGGNMGFFGDISLLLIDEVHMLGDSRGPALEAVVSRLKLLSQLPRLAGAPLSRLRIGAVSATITNVRDVGAWLRCPPSAARSFGDEFRATALQVDVKGYNSCSNDFLFERSLVNQLYPVVLQYLTVDGTPKPMLIFCASRKGAEESAQRLVSCLPQGVSRPGGPPHPFLRSAASAAALHEAAGRCGCAPLAACLRSGVGFHSAALSGADRALVETLFRSAQLLVLTTTSTLAQGVNLPARVCVVRGTKMYDNGGYREYSASSVLQMVGRAGRPQFDEKGLGVIMTERMREASYRAIASGGEPVESSLAGGLAELLCAEICARTVTDVTQALTWLKASFLWTRMQANPARYGLPPGASAGECEQEATGLLLRTCTRLADACCVAMDEDGFCLSPLPPGVEMSRRYVRFDTLVAAQASPPHLAAGDLLMLLAGAAEFSHVPLRQGEKVLLKSLLATVPFPVLGQNGKKAKTVGNAKEKLFLLAQDALCDFPSEQVAASHSLRMECEEVLKQGPRIARCIAAAFIHGRRLSGAAHALQLARACELRCSAGTGGGCAARQLQGVGPVLSRALSQGGLHSLDALEAASARRIEQLTGRATPFGANIKAQLARHPRVSVELVMEPGGASEPLIHFSVTVTTQPAVEGASHPPTPHAMSAATLLCGTRGDDTIWHSQRVRLSTEIGSEVCATFSVPREHAAPPHPPMQMVAGVVFDNVIGRDATAMYKSAACGGGGKRVLEEEQASAAGGKLEKRARKGAAGDVMALLTALGTKKRGTALPVVAAAAGAEHSSQTRAASSAESDAMFEGLF